jgi:hypothetical protein
MGADNLRQFHLWRHWRDIADLTPVAVVDRPGSTLKATSSRAAVALAPWRVPEADAARFADRSPPAFLFLHGPPRRRCCGGARKPSSRVRTGDGTPVYSSLNFAPDA